MSLRGIVVSEIVAELVTEARREEGLSTDELAVRAGLHPAYVGLLERRARQPTLAAATSLAEALGLSLSSLVAAADRGDLAMAREGALAAVQLGYPEALLQADPSLAALGLQKKNTGG